MREVKLPGDARLIVSQTFPLHGKTPSPLQGIAPHAPTPLTLRDLREGRDAALAAALVWLKSGKPLPPRLQPVE
jgi:hypothetical protein